MIFIILVISLVLRLISINQSVWLDEATTLNVAREFSFQEIVTRFSPGDFHPPFYYFLMRLWVAVFGNSEISGRSVSVIFGVLNVWIVYLIGKSLKNEKLGLVAGALIATAPLHIYYSQEARMYSMTAFLVSLAIYFFTKILHEKARVGEWLVFSFLIGLISGVHYLSILILPVFWIFGILNKQSPFWWKKFLLSHIILVIFGVLWLPIFLKQLNLGVGVSSTSAVWAQVLGQFSLKEILLIPAKFMIGRISFDNKLLYFGLLGAIASFFGYLGVKSTPYLKEKGYLSGLVYLWLLIPLGLGLAISLKVPILDYFRFLFVLPAFYLIISLGILSLLQKWQKAFLFLAILINLAFSGLYLFNPHFHREDWKGAVRYIEENKKENSIVIFPAESQMEAYLYYSPDTNVFGPKGVKKGYFGIWLVRYAQPISDPNDLTRQKIENLGYEKKNEFDFNGVVVWKY